MYEEFSSARDQKEHKRRRGEGICRRLLKGPPQAMLIRVSTFPVDESSQAFAVTFKFFLKKNFKHIKVNSIMSQIFSPSRFNNLVLVLVPTHFSPHSFQLIILRLTLQTSYPLICK